MLDKEKTIKLIDKNFSTVKIVDEAVIQNNYCVLKITEDFLKDVDDNVGYAKYDGMQLIFYGYVQAHKDILVKVVE